MKLSSFLTWRQKPEEVKERYFTFNDFFKTDAGWFQKALDQSPNLDVSSNTAVYTCSSIIAQELASLRLKHWRVDENGARVRVKNSAVERVMRKPNDYQTSSDFWLYMGKSLTLQGNALARATRNNRTEVDALHPLPPKGCTPLVGEDGSVFYSYGSFSDKLVTAASGIPATEILHLRMNCNRHPLIGETPIAALAASGIVGNAIQRATARFFTNMARPSGVLTTPKPLTKKQMDELREQWNAITAGENKGGTPVLHSDLKWEKITMSATDAEVIASYNLSVADVAMAYRIPLYMLGDLSKATFRNVESLNRLFYTSALRFYLELIENALNVLFQLDGEREYVEFDIDAGLLRGDFEQRMTALAKGVQGGILTPNEARSREELPPVDGGDDAFLQRQMTPISLITAVAQAELNKPAAEEPATSTDEETPSDTAGEDDEAKDDDTSLEEAKAFLREFMK